MRRGACPSLREPMQTGDGLLVRIPLAQGGFTPAGLIALAGAARAFGNGMMDVSARGNIQVRGLSAQTIAVFTTQIEALNIDIQQGLSISMNPLAGISDDGNRDPRPLMHAIRAAVDALTPALIFAPKLSIVVDGGGALHLDALKADIRMVAHEQGWCIVPTGKIVTNAEAPAAIAGLLKQIAACGPDARIADLGLSSAPPHMAEKPAQPIRQHQLIGGTIARGYGLPFGQISSENLADFARCVAADEGADIRPAPGRALIVTGLAHTSVQRLDKEAARIGFITDLRDPRNRITACVGGPACASAHIATHSLALMILDDAPQILEQGDMHISGCAKGCACTSPAALSLVGSDQGIKIMRGGKPFGDFQAICSASEILPYLTSADFRNTGRS